MVLTDLIWILFLTTCSVKPSPDNKDDVDHADTMITDDLLPLSMDNSAFVEAETFDELLDGASNAYFPQKRNKRALSSIAKGALASWKLLKDTISLPSTGKRYRNHAKQGNFLTAIKDFFDANPVGVEQTVTSTGVRQYSGRVGDRVLILRSEGRTLSREPTLDIIDFTGKTSDPGSQYIDRLFYKKDLDDMYRKPGQLGP